MHLNVLACDLDGTLAEDGTVSHDTWKALRRARRAGLTLILVTGRRLETFADRGPHAELFEAIVAEDGAAIYFPRNDSVVLPFGRLEPEVIRRLEARDMPLERGMAIVATWVPHDQEVLDVLRETGGGATVEYNKGAVMVLPPGATKGTGLQAALRELGYSPRNVIACGDAENDRSLFEVAELAVAVSNATPEIKARSDAVLTARNGQAIQGLIDGLLKGLLPMHRIRASRRLLLGHTLQGRAVEPSPFMLLDQNLGIAGASASGKSWLAGLIVEELLRLGYQVCVIDPEGDYRGLRAFPHTLVLGGPETPLPPVIDVLTLSEYTTISLIVDLSCYDASERSRYVGELLQGLLVLRKRRGRPHWFLLDEIHTFCPPEGSPLTELLVQEMAQGGFGFVGFRPSQVTPAVLEAIDHWLLTRMALPEEIAVLQRVLGERCPDDAPERLSELPVGQAYFCVGDTQEEDAPSSGLLTFKRLRRVVPHVRHLQKYLRAPLPESRRFYFRILGPYEGLTTAASMWEFLERLKTLPVATLRYHLERGDFERWTRGVLHDEELARSLRKIAGRPLDGTLIRQALVATVGARYDELESLI